MACGLQAVAKGSNDHKDDIFYGGRGQLGCEAKPIS
jgi:hypothetical protein